MKRKQIYITQELDKKIKDIAYIQNKTESSVIREALGEYIAKKEKNNLARDDNPLSSIIGLGESGKEDISINHDQYLYKIPGGTGY
ncbi:MAG: hypothetical protein ACOCRK_11530 [bacterium]